MLLCYVRLIRHDTSGMMLDILHCDAGISGRVHRKLVLIMLSQLLAASKEEAEERPNSVSEEMTVL